MTPSRRAFLMDHGVDYNDAMERFAGNEELFLKLIGMFLDDTSMSNLVAAMEEGDWEQAEHRAHSLKGVAGNLSFETLYQESAAISRLLREGNVSEAETHLPPAISAYNKAKEAAHSIRFVWPHEA